MWDARWSHVWQWCIIDVVILNTDSVLGVFRMDLQFETSEQLTQQILNSSIKTEDPEYYVYHLPGCDAHGKNVLNLFLILGEDVC